MTLPDAKDYKDIISSSQMTSLHQHAIDVFLTPLKGSLSSGTTLYNAIYLLYAKVAKNGENTCIRSECRAEMKKNITYFVDISISPDGFIRETQCECAAGIGPEAHCKHICAVLCGLQDFSTTGSIKRETSCTSVLQVFKKPNTIHSGSPVKASNLEVGKRCSETNVMFDPRPPQFRNKLGYSDYVCNLTLNNMFTPRIPLTQTFLPANIPAIDLDHDYMRLTSSQHFLECEKITSISPAEVAEIEDSTKLQSKSELWKKERMKRITSSNFGKVCKASDHESITKLAKNLLHPKSLDAVKAIRYGREKEITAKKEYEERSSETVEPVGLLISESHPYLGATPDGMVGESLVEIKCPYSARSKPVSPVTVPYLKTGDGEMRNMTIITRYKDN